MKNRNHHYQNSPNVTFSVGENIAKFLEEMRNLKLRFTNISK